MDRTQREVEFYYEGEKSLEEILLELIIVKIFASQ
ncbi:hypothetical protein SAMN02194393_01621 [Maledivibacter halophilus]|uniref:Uncharacterized protein n=1 Tax=Maledivibacter halophilus TaxID=36842 RepID=A0A1T5K4X0_9FIRM|nr:hypothetical protein SAMN02194393_01621 [Maledivibacter halophilus]